MEELIILILLGIGASTAWLTLSLLTGAVVMKVVVYLLNKIGGKKIMNIWDLLRKYDCINIKIESAEEMKEMLELAKENNFNIGYEDYHDGIYVYFEGDNLEFTYANLIDRQRTKQYNYDFQKIKHHLK